LLTEAGLTMPSVDFFSNSLLSFSGTSDGQQTTNPQQTLETTLQRHQQELEQLLKQHEAQRESLNRKIQSTAATLPVNHQAIEGLHRQMTEIHKRQDKEKQSLAKRHLLESNALRLGINPSGQPTEAEEELDENENGEVEVETSASLRLIDGLGHPRREWSDYFGICRVARNRSFF